MSGPETETAITLTTDQESCLDLHSNLAVVAGAGSGKTRVLVNRYITILDDFYNNDQKLGVGNILALTFTEKAALEMRDRIRKKILSLKQRDQPFWIGVIEELGEAHIGTIHSFCSRLLRSFPFESDLDPDFSVMDEADASLFQEDSIHALINSLAFSSNTEEDEHKAHVALMKLLQRWSLNVIEREVKRICRERGMLKPWIEKTICMTPDQLLAHWQYCLNTEKSRALQHFINAPDLKEARDILLVPASGAKPDSLSAVLDSVSGPFKRLAAADLPEEDRFKALDELVPVLLTKQSKPCSFKRKGKASNWAPGSLAALREALTLVAEGFGKYPVFTCSMSALEQENTRFTIALAQLSLHVINHLSDERRRAGAPDFTDLIEKTLQLMQNCSVRKHLAGKFRYIMIDEFQDTNSLQWELISAMARDEDGRLYHNRVFAVGDEKQSIYGFRGADVTVFEKVRQEFSARAREVQAESEIPNPPHDTVRELNINFRTLSRPLGFVNAIFHSIFPVSREHCDARDVPFQHLICHRTGGTSPSGSVEMLLPEKNPDKWHIKAQATCIAKRLQAAVKASEGSGWNLSVFDGTSTRPVMFGDCAVLLRRRSFLSSLEEAFLTAGVPYTVHAGIGFYQRQEVMDIYNVLRFLDNTNDDTSLAGVLRSPLFMLSDRMLVTLSGKIGESGGYWEALHTTCESATGCELLIKRARRILQRWLHLSRFADVAELIKTIASDAGYWFDLAVQSGGSQAAENVEKLIRLAEEAGRQQHVHLTEFVRRLGRLVSGVTREGAADPPEAAGNAVQIMTVHAAKGLEFPVVVVPELDAGFNLGTSDRVYTSPGLGLGLKVEDPENRFEETGTVSRFLIKDHLKRTAFYEEKRLFYVALTRARDHLILSGERDGRGLKKWGSHRLPDDNVSCWLEWLAALLPLTGEDLTLDHSAESFTVNDASETIPVKLIHTADQIPCFRPCATGQPDISDDTVQKTLDVFSSMDSPLLYPVMRKAQQVVFSPTDLVNFNSCPMQFATARGLGLPVGSLSSPAPPSGAHNSPDTATLDLSPIEKGMLTHNLLEQIEETFRSGSSLEELVDRVIDTVPTSERSETSGQRRSYLLSRGRLFMATELFSQFRSLSSEDSLNEVPFILDCGNALVEGRIDKLFKRGNHWQVLDYKTTRLDNYTREKVLTKSLHHYEPQMLLYALAAQRSLFMPLEEIRASLFFTEIMEERPVSMKNAQEKVEQLIDEAYQAITEAWKVEARGLCPSARLFEREPSTRYLMELLFEKLENRFSRRFPPPESDYCAMCPLSFNCRRNRRVP